MYNQGNMRLHVDLFIKYVSNNVYSDNNHGQPQSILNIFLICLVAYTCVAYFRSDIDIIVFFLLGGMKMSGSAGLFNNFIFFNLVGSPNVDGAGDGKHKKYGHRNGEWWPSWYWRWILFINDPAIIIWL